MHMSEAKIDHMKKKEEKKNFDSVQLLLINLALALQIFSLYLSMHTVRKSRNISGQNRSPIF